MAMVQQIPTMLIFSTKKVRLICLFNFSIEAVLFSQTCYKFNFNEYCPYTERHIIVTKSALRVYENKRSALSTYGKPLIAIPFNAIETIERTMMDHSFDTRMEKANSSTLQLNKNMFEFCLKDDFLPIYTHQHY